MGWLLALGLVSAVNLAIGADYLLPGDVVPSHYDVRFVYDIDPKTNFSFYGIVNIMLTSVKPTSKIVLHAQDFKIDNDKVSISNCGEDAASPAVQKISLNDTYNLLTIELDRELKKDMECKLTIPFYGNLKPGLDGVYISSYPNKATNEKEYLVATQFEAISARKGFPCFDEPMYKATFKVTIGHHKQFTAVSNMPLENISHDNSLEEYWPWTKISSTIGKEQSIFVFDHFKKSVPMSTYLVAMVVSKFKYTESPSGLSDTRFRIWARSDAINQTTYASIIGPKVLSHFEKWFNVSFPLPKQDMVAIPDFSAGAMENWGLVTYRETALLFDEKESSLINKERIAEVIAHELAHQWFGNLVTMKWWSDLWLNEGFATFVAGIGVDAVEPDWKSKDSYDVSNMMTVLTLDALESSHPVSVQLDDPKRIAEIFDTISYLKGSTLIRMMTMFMGEEAFREAIHNYLVKFSYKNAAQDDLWAELTAITDKRGSLPRGVTVKQVMDTWSTQTGYPILNVVREYSDNTLSVTQRRYLSLGTKSTSSSSWWVPLRVLCENETLNPEDSVHWLSDEHGVNNPHRFEHGAKANEWVLFNADMIAPYRVNYDERNWKLLVNTMTSDHYTTIPMLSRIQLLSDSFALAWTNVIEYSIPLSLSNYLQLETEYLPLSSGLNSLAKIENAIKRSQDYGAFQKFIRKLLTNKYQETGGLARKRMNDDSDLKHVKMQVMLGSWGCRSKIQGCEDTAIELFKEWMDSDNPDDYNPIPLEVRRTVYCVAIARGSVREWRFALERRRAANVATVRDALTSGLACTRDVWLLSQYLEWAITDGSEIRRQDSGSVIASVARSTVGYYVARDFLYNRIEDIYKAFSSESRRLGGIIKALLDQFSTQRELDQFIEWREQNSKYLDGSKLAVDQGIENARVNIAWLQKHRKQVVDKLRELAAQFKEDLGSNRNKSSKFSYATTLTTLLLTLIAIKIS